VQAEETKKVDAEKKVEETQKIQTPKGDWDTLEQKEKNPFVDKGDFRIGVMGSIDTGKYAGFFLQAVSQFTIDAEFEYYIHKRLAPITRFSSTIIFTDQDNITAFSWGAGIKGVFNFDKRFLPYVKVIPEVYYYNLDFLGSVKDKSIHFALLAGVGLDVLLTRNVAVGFVFHYEVIFSDQNYTVYSFPFGFSFYW